MEHFVISPLRLMLFVFSLYCMAFFRYSVFSIGVILSWRRDITQWEKMPGVFCLFWLVFRHFAWHISLFRLSACRCFVISIFRVAFLLFRPFAWLNFTITPGEKRKKIMKWHKPATIRSPDCPYESSQAVQSRSTHFTSTFTLLIVPAMHNWQTR